MIVIDSNAGESSVFEALTSLCPHTQIARRRLDVGDVQINAESVTVIIERKRTPDLLASISDGRLKEQRTRLLALREEAASGGRRVIIAYIIEGGLLRWDGAYGGMRNSSAICAMVMTAVADEVPVLYAATPTDTAHLIKLLYDKAAHGKLDPQARAAGCVARGYNSLVAKQAAKRKASDFADTWEKMLCSISGCSGAKSQAITAKYPSAALLARAYAGLSHDAAIMLLAELEVPGSTKRLGRALSAKVYSAFDCATV